MAGQIRKAVKKYYTDKVSAPKANDSYIGQNSSRYKQRYNDMVADPEKYYNAFEGNVTKLKQETAYYEYMSSLADAGLPDDYTYNAQRYDDMRANPQKYLDAYGGSEGTYKAELERYKELYGLEKTRNNEVMNYVNDRVKVDFLAEKGLDSVYQYNLDDPEDALLYDLGYAPKSFEYRQSQLDERAATGLKASDYFKADKDGNLTEDGAYLSAYYQYDFNDEDDVLNAALGLMPKSFKYGNTDDDKAREYTGALPVEGELFVKNSKQFAAEYAEYSQKMQEYRDQMEEYNALGAVAKWFAKKPVDPYPSDLDKPATVRALLEYKGNVEMSAEEEPDFFLKKPETEARPHFWFSDDTPIYIDDFTPSDTYEKKQQYKQEYAIAKSAAVSSFDGRGQSAQGDRKSVV